MVPAPLSGNPALLDRLCAACGIATGYRDARGETRTVPVETRIALLAAMGVEVRSDADIERALEACEAREWRRVLPPVSVVPAAALRLEVRVTLPAAALRERFEWVLELEDGARRGGSFEPEHLTPAGERRVGGATFVRFAFSVADPPAPGYHRFEIAASGGRAPLHARMALIVVPPRCYLPPAVERGRVWGPMAGLWAVRSRRNWGMGDYTDLRNLMEFAAESGAALVGVNPLHALFPHDPDHASPYSPASRARWNVLYLDPEGIPDFPECAAARELFESPAFQARLRALRAAEQVDYPAVAGAKFEVFELLFAHFAERHIAAGTARARAFDAFRQERGEELRLASLFFALQERLIARDPASRGWRAWPGEYRDPGSAAVAAFSRANAARVDFHDYLQWNAELQLDAAGKRSLELGLGVGLYQDLAVGVDPGGAEAWGHQSLYAREVSIGAPPDDLNLNGQDWGLPPYLPRSLMEAAYAPFIAVLRANMRHAGALRIDHVMGLMRLYWIPAGQPPPAGAYVSYPFEDLLGILALESRRNRCMVIGEDLGTVPEGLVDRLHEAGVLSCRLLYFEREPDRAFKSPRRYPAQALAAVSTHDLPTLRAFWRGCDLDLRSELQLYPDPESRQRQVVERARDRALLLIALDGEKLLPAGVATDPVSAPEMTPALALGVHRYLARTPCRLLTVQLEDVFGQVEQPNVPATSGAQHPNWRHRLALELEQWGADERVRALAAALREERSPALARAPREPRVARIPDATYRLQLSGRFTFAQAAELVPYLHELGISHVYCSPYLKARPGSLHGYDIIDHNALNPEIGSLEDFERFAAALKSRGMGQLMDLVPNHMGVMGADNGYWLDVLENGPASAYAGFFDIDWESPQPELRGKVLVPVLEEHYGAALESGKLRLDYDAAAGAFSVFYGPHRFPVDPAEYPRILALRAEQLAQRLGAENPVRAEFESLATAFAHLPPRGTSGADALLERQRDKEVHKRRLGRLSARSQEIARHLEETLAQINGQPGHRESFEALDALLASQAYRLAYWRVAADEINYRRFFDVNDLAALRMEDPRIFEATHQLVFRLLEEGKVDGLRIDHPDGLYEPARYFERLQERFVVEPADGAANAAAGESARRPIYVVAEKILADHERLPQSWPVHGTTGYRFANVVNGLFVDTAAESQMDRVYRAFVRERIDYEELLYRSKLVVMKGALAAELNVLANRLTRIARADWHTRDFTLNSMREAIATVVACFPVYRTYADAGVSPEDRRYIEWAVGVARRRNRQLDANVLEFLRGVLLLEAASPGTGHRLRELPDFVKRFQQFTAAVTAKGMEDTAFYGYNRLVSLNEVGGNPRCYGLSLQAFHHASLDRARNWPHTLLATSTHDTKRSEDVRARIDVLSELPGEWWARLQRWRRINRRRKCEVEGIAAPSANDEYLVYQALIGTWPPEPLDAEAGEAYRARIEAYALKAAREAKARTSWMNADEAYESAVRRFVAALVEAPGSNRFLADFVPFARRVARIGQVNSLSQLVIKITSPGVPDFYQGCELWTLDLVDPDNRRPVDFERRRALLDELKARFKDEPARRVERARALLDDMANGRVKLYVTWRGLTVRRAMRQLFAAGEYLPLETAGEHAQRLCAFARADGAAVSITLAPRLIAGLPTGAAPPLGEAAWGDTRVILPPRLARRYWNVFTGEELACESATTLDAAVALASFPVAILASGMSL